MGFRSGIVDPPLSKGVYTNRLKIKELLAPIFNIFDLILFSQEQDCVNKEGILIDKKKIQEDYLKIVETYSSLAEDNSLYISPGILFEFEKEDVYKTTLLFDPDGEIVLKQRQIYINKDLKKRDKQSITSLKDNGIKYANSIKLSSGKAINYIDTEFGKFGFMIGNDCWHPQIGRVMALDGVDIVLAFNKMKNFLYNKVVYNPWQQLAGVWSQVQQNQFIALEASIGGQNLIHAPCEITPYRTGIIAPKAINKEPAENNIIDYFDLLSKNYKELDGFKIVSSEINIDSLKEIRSSYPLVKYLNKPLYCKEMGGEK